MLEATNKTWLLENAEQHVSVKTHLDVLAWLGQVCMSEVSRDLSGSASAKAKQLLESRTSAAALPERTSTPKETELLAAMCKDAETRKRLQDRGHSSPDLRFAASPGRV